MKKKLLLFLAFISLNIFSQSIINLKDSAYSWGGDTATNSWKNLKKTIYAYNGQYKEIGFVSSDSLVGSWINTNSCANYSYDSNNNLLSQTYQNWSGSAWVNNYQLINTYDVLNNKLTEITQYWNSSSSAWVNARKRTYTYDSFNNKLSELNQNWKASNSTWINDDYFDWYIYTYDSHNNIVTSITKRWLNINMAWMNYKKDSVSYNLNDEYISFIKQSWSGTWNNSSKMTNIVYSSGDLVSYEWQYWNGTAFDPGNKYQDLYNSNHKIINSIRQNWSTTLTSWVNSTKIDYTYDINGNEITYLNQQWYQATWVNFFRIHNYYTSFVGIKENAVQHSDVTINPNPTTNSIVISNTNNVLFNEVSVSDITGKVVLSEKVIPTTSITLNITLLNSGIYFISLKGNDFTSYKKIIKE